MKVFYSPYKNAAAASLPPLRCRRFAAGSFFGTNKAMINN